MVTDLLHGLGLGLPYLQRQLPPSSTLLSSSYFFHHLQGIINFGTSENKLCFDLLSNRVSPGCSTEDRNVAFPGNSPGKTEEGAGGHHNSLSGWWT